MDCMNGNSFLVLCVSTHLQGSIAYVPQIPWIQNSTVRDNITWGQPYDPKFYRRVVRACALQMDFDMLPAGDMTEIGENVSTVRFVLRRSMILQLPSVRPRTHGTYARAHSQMHN